MTTVGWVIVAVVVVAVVWGVTKAMKK